MRVFKPRREFNSDEPKVNLEFEVHKFTKKEKPSNPKEINFISCFSEFGCETVGVLYNVPIVLRKNPHKYNIVLGWYGREYFYRHLADEFWELKEDYMWLRDYSKAYHSDSFNIKSLERKISQKYSISTTDYMGKLAVGNICASCNYCWGDISNLSQKICPNCRGGKFLHKCLFGNIAEWKSKAIPLPKPCFEKVKKAKEIVGKKPVAIFARGRKTYGRNLQPEFYVKLISLLERMGYDPIWMGEKQSTQPCPVDHIIDFSRMEESRDLELTCAIVSQCHFTVQFWTASTRIASLMEVPYLLFESPDQIWGTGQEGYRRNLVDIGNRKLAACHFLSVYENNDDGILLVERCVREMEEGNWEDVMGMVNNKEVVKMIRRDNIERIGG